MADDEIEVLIARLRDTARRDADTHWFDVASTETVLIVEQSLDVELPEILKRCYTEISNEVLDRVTV